MPRINVEDSLFRDPRYQELQLKLGDRHRALGAIVEAWITGLEFYTKSSDRYIPLTDWKRRGLRDEIIDVNLAEVRGESIYLCGAETQFAWLKQRIDAGKAGGKAKSAAKIKNLKQYRSGTEARSKRKVAEPSKTEASSSSSSSISNSFSDSERIHVGVVEEIFESYCQSWDRDSKKYKLTPTRRAWIQKAVDLHGADGAKLAVQNFRNDTFENRSRFNDIEYLFGGTEKEQQKRIDRWCTPGPSLEMEKARAEHIRNKDRVQAAIALGEELQRAKSH